MGITVYYDGDDPVAVKTSRLTRQRSRLINTVAPLIPEAEEDVNDPEARMIVTAGETITVTQGTYNATPVSVTETLRQFDLDSAEVGSGTVGTSWVVPNNPGHTLYVEEAIVDARGRHLTTRTFTAYIVSADSEAVAPINLAGPSIAGIAEVGGTLSVVSSGEWIGAPVPDITVNWQRNEVDISGATSLNYVVQADDDHAYLRVRVTATNTEGSATEYSEAILISEPIVVGTQQRSGATLTAFDNAAAGVEIGDAIVYFGFVHNSLTVPELPTGHTSIGTSSGNSCAAIASYKIADATDLGATWTPTGATRALMAVVRDFYPPDPIKFSGWRQSLNPTPNWPGIGVSNDSLILGFRGIRASGAATNVYPGMKVIAATPSNATIQATVTGTAPPYDTVLTSTRSAYTEPNIGNSLGAHCALLLINSWSSNVIAPINIQIPAFSGTPTDGQVLTKTSDGNWFGAPTPDFTYQWLRNGAAISGATTSTYHLVTLDVGAQVSLQVTATNIAGSAVATSDSVSVAAATAMPVNTVQPSITGTPVVGNTLTANDGTWTGTPTPNLSRKWQRDGADIALATATTYVLQAADAGHQIRIFVTGQSTAGTANAASNAVSVTAAAVAPVNTAQPKISGNPVVGQTLTAADGTWTGTATISYTRKWQKDGVDIALATNPTYVPVAGDATHQISVLVTATNSAGSSSASSASVLVTAAPVAPTNTVQPTITGTPSVGQTLTANDGTWTGTATISYTRKWQRDGADIASATGTTYVLQEADAERAIRVLVTASNGVGSPVSAASNAVTVDPLPLAPVNNIAPTISGTGTVGSTLTRDNNGSWSGTPTILFARQWQRDGVDIAGEVATTYVLTSDDGNHNVGLKITATNDVGVAVAYSNVIAVASAVQPPANVIAPTITGDGTIGSTLSRSNNGSWTGTPTILFARQWQRDGIDISGEVATSYVTVTADGGHNVGLKITATNDAGVATAFSNVIAVAAAGAAPVNTVAPVISGTGTVGSTLTKENNGTWTGTTPMTFSRNWQRAGVDIASATANTYVLVAADAGQNITCRVIADNGVGSPVSKSSNTIAVAGATAPVNTVLPAITGSATVGSTLTGSTGTWTGTAPISYARQWQRSGNNISGATGNTYTLVAADAGLNVRVRVTASNDAEGSPVSANSAAVLVESGASGDWAIVNVTPSNYRTAFAANRTKKTRYRCAAGVYRDFWWPSDVTDFEIQVIPQDRTDPPTFRSMNFGRPSKLKGNMGFYWNETPRGSNFTKKITLDGLNFIAERFATCNNLNLVNLMGDNAVVSNSINYGESKAGIGWRVQGTNHPSAAGRQIDSKEGGNYTGLGITTVNGPMLIQNCLFDGYAAQIDINPNNGRPEIRYNTFQNAAEDVIKANGSWWSHHNECTAIRQAKPAHVELTGGPQGRAHADFVQMQAPLNDVKVEYNFMHTVRPNPGTNHVQHMNGGQLRNGPSAGKCQRMTFRWNEFRMIGNTGILINNIERDNGNGIDGTGYDLIIEGNKIWPEGEDYLDSQDISLFPFFSDYEQEVLAGGTRIRFVNNRSDGGSGHGLGSNNLYNVSGGAPGDYPDNWQHIARDKVGAGNPFAGRYGATAGVIPSSED